jgi:hypothetical protein
MKSIWNIQIKASPESVQKSFITMDEANQAAMKAAELIIAKDIEGNNKKPYNTHKLSRSDYDVETEAGRDEFAYRIFRCKDPYSGQITVDTKTETINRIYIRYIELPEEISNQLKLLGMSND